MNWDFHFPSLFLRRISTSEPPLNVKETLRLWVTRSVLKPNIFGEIRILLTRIPFMAILAMREVAVGTGEDKM